MSLELSNDERARLKSYIDAGLRVKQEIEDLTAGLKDTTKALAEELNIKPAVLNEVLTIAHKAKYADKKEHFDTVEEILHITGRL